MARKTERTEDTEERVRRKAYELWLADGRPHGRHELHWEQAREIIALEDAGGLPTRRLEDTIDEPVEPALAFENQGEFPEIVDQGENLAGPELAAAVETADTRPRPGPMGDEAARTRAGRTAAAKASTEQEPPVKTGGRAKAKKAGEAAHAAKSGPAGARTGARGKKNANGAGPPVRA